MEGKQTNAVCMWVWFVSEWLRLSALKLNTQPTHLQIDTVKQLSAIEPGNGGVEKEAKGKTTISKIRGRKQISVAQRNGSADQLKPLNN